MPRVPGRDAPQVEHAERGEAQRGAERGRATREDVGGARKKPAAPVGAAEGPSRSVRQPREARGLFPPPARGNSRRYGRVKARGNRLGGTG